jgi:RNase H-fold protein (predicted Holliday junction resolvase)
MVHLQMTDPKEMLAPCVKLWAQKIKNDLLADLNNPLMASVTASVANREPIPWDERWDVKEAKERLKRLGVEATRERVEAMMEITTEIEHEWSDY